MTTLQATLEAIADEIHAVYLRMLGHSASENAEYPALKAAVISVLRNQPQSSESTPECTCADSMNEKGCDIHGAFYLNPANPFPQPSPESVPSGTRVVRLEDGGAMGSHYVDLYDGVAETRKDIGELDKQYQETFGKPAPVPSGESVEQLIDDLQMGLWLSANIKPDELPTLRNMLTKFREQVAASAREKERAEIGDWLVARAKAEGGTFGPAITGVEGRINVLCAFVENRALARAKETK